MKAKLAKSHRNNIKIITGCIKIGYPGCTVAPILEINLAINKVYRKE